ncbi:hypothetical protein DFH07DRAFT_956360 [Mycena maculata]|uniref:Uncharacterized protein n=1 Tax=Mycena maculata TaxID=230809 RepID=A0AAD7NJA6_9AGAR|nr:hypothetical protein DFH07DRAFT_956360 [Mycena maculata]
MSTDNGDEHPPPPHAWNAPGVHALPISPPFWNGFPGKNPLPLHRLRFTPLGVYDLHRHLGVYAHSPEIWNTYHLRFKKSRIAWLASGVSTDNQHHPSDPGFFPELKALRDSLPIAEKGGYAPRQEFVNNVREILFDVATILDRIIGSTTLILHSEGITRPRTPARPEFLSSTVYIPPAFLAANPEAHMDIARIVQAYIETVGVLTVNAWTTNTMRQRWPLNSHSTSSIPTANYIRPGLIIPDPKQVGSSVYIFRGRPAGSLDATPAIAVAPPDPVVASPTASGDGREELYSQDALNLISEIEHNHALMMEIQELRGQVTFLEDSLIQTQSALASREAAHDAECAQFQRSISSLQHQLHRASVITSSTSVSRAPENAGPPSYASSSQLFTPTKSRTLDSPRSAPTASPSKSEIALPLTTAYLEDLPMSDLRPVRLMIRRVTPTKWYEELATLGYKGDAVQGLLDALTEDLGL